MTMCPHGHGELDSAGKCPQQNLHVKARVGVACPLCGGPAHKRETDHTTQQLQCAWRQFTRSRGMTGMLDVDGPNVDGFATWFSAHKPSAGRQAQYEALAASGTPLSPAMAKDAARYTPGATTVAVPSVPPCHACGLAKPLVGFMQRCAECEQAALAARAAEAQHTPAQAQETASSVSIAASEALCIGCQRPFHHELLDSEGRCQACQAPVALPTAPEGETPEERRARLRQALAG